MSLLLPSGARLVHIGPQKTGSSSLQAALHRRRAELADLGVVYPGPGSRPRTPVWALIGTPDGSPKPPREKWDEFAQEVARARDARVCVSNEALARVDPALARQVVADLGGPRVHVVAAARSLASLLPSQWQQRVRMRRTAMSFDDWLREVLDPQAAHPEAQNVWTPHDVGSLIQRWVTALGDPGRFTLLISDRSQPELIPRAFEEMLGLPVGLLELPEGGQRNQSLGLGRVELIRRVTAAVQRHDWPLPPSHPLIVRLTNTIKYQASWPDEPQLPGIPEWAVARVAELDDQRCEALRSTEVRVVGDPELLRQWPEPRDPPDNDSPAGTSTAPVMVPVELAAAGLEELLAYALERERAAREAQRRVRRLRRRLRQQREGNARGGTGARLRSRLRSRSSR